MTTRYLLHTLQQDLRTVGAHDQRLVPSCQHRVAHGSRDAGDPLGTCRGFRRLLPSSHRPPPTPEPQVHAPDCALRVLQMACVWRITVDVEGAPVNWLTGECARALTCAHTSTCMPPPQ